jgi:hypothetical protein
MASVANATPWAVAAAARGRIYTKEALEKLSKPSFVNGRWRAAELNGRAMNRIRKEYLIRGDEFPLAPKPTRNDKIDQDRKPKGHKSDRIRAERCGSFAILFTLFFRLKKIAENMSTMPAMVEEHLKERREARAAKRPPTLAIPLVPEV